MASQRAIEIADHTFKRPVSSITEQNPALANIYTGGHLIAVRQAILDQHPSYTDDDFDLIFDILNLDRDFNPDQKYTLASDQPARSGRSFLNATKSRPPRGITPTGVWRKTHRPDTTPGPGTDQDSTHHVLS